MLKSFIFLLCVAASLYIGFPIALMGILALSGSLNMPPSDSIRYGLLHLGVAAPIFAVTFGAYIWLFEKFSFRFELRQILTVITVVSLALGAIAAIRFHLGQ